MFRMQMIAAGVAFIGILIAGSGSTVAAASDACKDLPSHSALQAALASARAASNGGFNLDMWATVVNRDGEVCAVAFRICHPVVVSAFSVRAETSVTTRLTA